MSEGRGSGNGGPTAGTQSITRTLAVLAAFRDDEADLGVSEVASRLGLSSSTIHRIIRALAAEGYLAQNAATERYYLGRGAVLLGQAANRRLGVNLIQSVLDRVVAETGESVNLGVRDGGDMVVLMRTESTQPLRISQPPGSRLPIYATGMGKATLAHSASIDKEIEALDHPLHPLTPKTITSAERLRAELNRVRKRGYSTDDEEAIPGVRCVAVPVLSNEGELLAALAIQGPVVRMPRARLTDLAPIAIEAAQEISEMIPSARQL
ncbi:IclR family transcriptional regulator [Rhodococcus opacus]|uniref:IclR family transcriptional regulator n=1 Tax=Rhodococcus opacus TaxID=37919 RepID=UPI00223639DB|nr:IclR family transcriptional regulator [Rhodococcus opacus]UZG60372.1 IclR family transcriptional regulator [Rhodococcus opacus]